MTPSVLLDVFCRLSRRAVEAPSPKTPSSRNRPASFVRATIAEDPNVELDLTVAPTAGLPSGMRTVPVTVSVLRRSADDRPEEAGSSPEASDGARSKR